MNKHTPGPWFADFYRRSIVVTKDSPAFERGGFNIATFPMRTNKSLVTHEEWEANANLIAAAPEIYEALKNCINELQQISYGNSETITMASIAISKAEGKL